MALEEDEIADEEGEDEVPNEESEFIGSPDKVKMTI